MKTERLKQIGSMIPVVGMAVLALGGTAHAGEICIPFFHYCFEFSPPAPHSYYASAPELDVGMAVSGVTMLVASVLVIVERRRRR